MQPLSPPTKHGWPTNMTHLPYGSNQYVIVDGIVYYTGDVYQSPSPQALADMQWGLGADLRRYNLACRL